jgi:hypothetical protein
MTDKTIKLSKKELITLIRNSENITFTVGVYDEHISEASDGCIYDYEVPQSFKKDDKINFISEIKIVR